jgi:hypothetical protein
MKKVSFDCNNESVYLFCEIINKLINAYENQESKKIRIGGSEYEFKGEVDSISSLAIDDKLFFDYTSDERSDFEKARIDALNLVISAPVSIPPVSIPPVPVIDTKKADVINVSMMEVEVKDLVNDKVGKNELFTAFDITKSFRNNGVKYSHNEVKKIVHNMFENGDMMGYDRVRTDKTGAPVQPFLYFPISADISTYQIS